eukprot:15326867-Ditylum_brightwellii.AAC.2
MLSLQQSNPTEQTAAGMTHLLNYCAMYPNTAICYHAFGMALHIHSNASYLMAPEGCSRAGGYFFLSFVSKDPAKPPLGQITLNSLMHNLCEVMQNAIASVAEAEVGVLFSNVCMGEQLRRALEEMGYQKPHTPICTDNSMAEGIVNNKLKQCWSHATDMRFYWVRN